MAAPQPGKFGDISFSAEVLQNRFRVSNNYQITPKTSGYPVIQKHGDPLLYCFLKLRLDIEYNRLPNTPFEIIRRLLVMTESGEFGYEFTFGGQTWGNFVIDEINFSFVQMVDTGQPEIIDVELTIFSVN